MAVSFGGQKRKGTAVCDLPLKYSLLGRRHLLLKPRFHPKRQARQALYFFGFGKIQIAAVINSQTVRRRLRCIEFRQIQNARPGFRRGRLIRR